LDRDAALLAIQRLVENLQVIYCNGVDLSIELAWKGGVNHKLHLEPRTVAGNSDVLADNGDSSELSLLVEPVPVLWATGMQKNFHGHDELLKRTNYYCTA
ncbi:hypothetical protein ACE8C3_21745, partial [Xanthomonas euvesicatoria pv. euvesicatoria]|uniref:hypothetical protein n=1 Tax=Xanthomonas euvesicatoria TaxID=456327 RepID=UPI003B673DE5